MSKWKNSKKTELDIYSIICAEAGMSYGQLQVYQYQHCGEFPEKVKDLAKKLLKDV